MTTRSEIAAAFRAAKPFLARTMRDGKYSLICIAISRAVNCRRINSLSGLAARSIIRARISPYVYATDWLERGAGVIDGVTNSNYADVQAWRHRWLDSLIEEFSKE